MLVAEEGDEILGTGSVMLERGAYSDLVGEFGRLAVRRRAWGRGIGARLLEERVRRVEERLHVGFMEARVTHPHGLKGGLSHGFAPVGFLPMKTGYGDRREHNSLLVRYFGDALALRRNHPRIVPEAFRIATAAMTQVGLEPDVVVDESAPPYPPGGDHAVQELTDRGYSSLLRIERGRVQRREVFGPMRLHYGFFRLRSRHSNYLIARQGGAIAGAVGFTIDEHEQNVRVFELICLDDTAIRFLLLELERRCREELGTHCIEIDVSAYAPRMQRTLVELGYLAAGYVPALVFHQVERLDVVKMLRLLVPLERGDIDLLPPANETAELVLAELERRQALPRIGEVVQRAGLFAGLTQEQAQRLAGLCSSTSFEDGESIFAEGAQCREQYLILSGEVSVEVGETGEQVGTVGPGECLGEVALLTGTPHSAGATAVGAVDAAVMSRSGLEELVRLRPDIGVVLYRNLASGLGEKLRRTDLVRLAEPQRG
jgi:CRP-like cAMP-binding protein/RimJ/RimL family protein N-acetyltransferase